MSKQKVLSSDIWSEIGKRAKSAGRRKAAIAHVTKDHIGFQAGDVLIVDASKKAIASGQTDAPLLRELDRKGVAIYSQEGLHAKVLLLGSYCVVGSANMSGFSGDLIEAAVVSNSAVFASGVDSFITQLARPRARLKSSQIEALCKVEVLRVGGANAKGSKRKNGSVRWVTLRG